MKNVIAVVDDDPEFLEFINFTLGRAGYKIKTFETPGRFLDGVSKDRPHLCIVDVSLPGMDGRELIRVLRANDSTRNLPLIAVTALAVSAKDAIRGFTDGADEYLRKPIDPDLLAVRIQGLLARARAAGPAPASPPLIWNNMTVYPDEHRVEIGNDEIALTRLEFSLLCAFMRQPNRVLPRAWLLQDVWGSSPAVNTRTVDKHVETLRKKLPPFAQRVETVVGVGYLFRP